MSSINVTPLTDVLLVLLITFLLSATSFQEPGGTDIPLPRVADAREVSQSMTRLAVSSKGDVEWPAPAFEGASSTEAFARLRTEQRDKPILALAVHRQLPYGRLYPILLAARQAGWEQIVLLTQAAP